MQAWPRLISSLSFRISLSFGYYFFKGRFQPGTIATTYRPRREHCREDLLHHGRCLPPPVAGDEFPAERETSLKNIVSSLHT